MQPCQKQLTVNEGLFLDSRFHPIGLCVSFMSGLHRLPLCGFVVSPKIGKCESFNFVPLFHDCLATLGPSSFYSNFRIGASISAKKPAELRRGVASRPGKAGFSAALSSCPRTWDVFHFIQISSFFQKRLVVFRYKFCASFLAPMGVCATVASSCPFPPAHPAQPPGVCSPEPPQAPSPSVGSSAASSWPCLVATHTPPPRPRLCMSRIPAWGTYSSPFCGSPELPLTSRGSHAPCRGSSHALVIDR